MEWKVQFGEKTRRVKLPEILPDNVPFQLELDGRTIIAKWQRVTKTLFVKNNNNSNSKGEVWRSLNNRSNSVSKFTGETDVSVALEFTPTGSSHMVCSDAVVALLIPGQEGREGNKANKPKTIRSQMTGKVLKILVRAGDTVSSSDTILIIEAMKMENRVLAGTAGIIDLVKVIEGSSVTNGAELIRFK
ncbi:MAG: acetyl-CoA carboxylase biotin carboxyl carrier protein subunit [Proteobacteria bacterium]|nr:acetyl-CoA carboxylase biotin carboxyl carrier protein subunit [Pseudomonadota bacterium]